MKNQKPSISTIAANLKTYNGEPSQFFSRYNMRLFGNTIKDFKVFATDAPNAYRIEYTIPADFAGIARQKAEMIVIRKPDGSFVIA
jgi:hypothetical protein